MSAPFAARPEQNVPSSADWTQLLPIVKELYHDRRWSMAQVRDHLRSLGYWVNTRMIRARISQWNLQRNNQIYDMVSALRLLDPDPARWPVRQPCFLIRGRQVALSEVLQYFRRKGIRNPIQWCHSAAIDPDASAVTLLHERPHDVSGNRGDSAEEAEPSPSLLVTQLLRSGQMTTVHVPTMIVTLEEKAVANLSQYCTAYVSLGLVANHPEPEVHQFTTHGRFGNRMQEGLAQMARGGPGAFPNFRLAFDLVQPLLSDCHPMSLGQVLATACELSACGAQPVLASLLRYLEAMASSLRLSSSLIQFLSCLSSLPPMQLQSTIISSLRAAQSLFSEQYPHTWHSLYMQERLCDCLYYGKDHAEGSKRRAHLLKAQEAFYGPLARNVVWTVTNVADDRLNEGDLDGAEVYYLNALTRAEHLKGFSRAKSRYAALEGLGRVELQRFKGTQQGMPTYRNWVEGGSHLDKAYKHVGEALNEAMIWFDPTSRRIGRVTEQKDEIMNLSWALNRNVPSSD